MYKLSLLWLWNRRMIKYVGRGALLVGCEEYYSCSSLPKEQAARIEVFLWLGVVALWALTCLSAIRWDRIYAERLKRLSDHVLWCDHQ